MFLPKHIFSFILLPLVFANFSSGEDPKPPPEEEQIEVDSLISEKDNVNLVEDGTAEDALKRRPDLRFNNIKLDGENTQISLSDIPAEALASIEVLKAVTPDLDADSRGGSLTLRSRPTYLQSKRTLKGEANLRYISGGGMWAPNFRLTYGNTIGSESRIGFLVTGEWETNKLKFQNHSLNWEERDVAGETQRVLRNQRLNEFKRLGKGPSIAGTIDFKVTDTLSLFLKAGYEKEDTTFEFPIFRLLYEDGTYASANESGASVEGLNIRRGIREWAETETTKHMAIGGLYKNDSFELDFRIYDSETEEDQPSFFVVDFLQSDVDVDYDLAERRYPQYDEQNGSDIKDVSQYEFEDLSDRHRNELETEQIATMNFKKPVELGTWNGFLKAGLKTRVRTEDRRADNRVYDIFNGDFGLEDVLSEESIIHSDGRYILDTFPDGEASREFFDNNEDDFVYNERRSRESSDPQTYNAEETVQSGYAMASIERNKLRILFGFRAEDTSIDYTANEVLVSETGDYIGTNEITGNSSYTNWFPSLHARYRLNDQMTFIASRTETIKRPRYSQVVPFRNINLEDRNIREGNPDLRATLFTNYDLSLDYAPYDGTFLSFELFYKQIEDPISSVLTTISGGVYDGFERTRFENIEQGTMHGIEFSLNQQLGSIWNTLDGFSVNTNLRLQETEPATTNISNSEFRVTLSYDKAKWYWQLEYHFLSDYPVRLNDDILESISSFSETRLSATLSHRLSDNIRIELEVNNITSELTRATFEGFETYPAHSRFSPWTSEISMKFTL